MDCLLYIVTCFLYMLAVLKKPSQLSWLQGIDRAQSRMVISIVRKHRYHIKERIPRFLSATLEIYAIDQ